MIDLKAFSFEVWFKPNVSLDCGIWLGKGLDTSTIHSLVTPIRQLKAPIADNFGYVIGKGVATRMKVLESEDNG